MSFATNKILLFFFCFIFVSSIAQNEFVTYTKSTGLTSSNILSTKVDHKGIIWAATSSGINAFTGDSWVPIRSIADKKGKNNTLGRVNQIFEALNGELWVITEKGLFIYNGKYWTFFYDGDNDGFSVTDIFEDRRGWIWVTLEKGRSLKDISDVGFALTEGKIQVFNGFLWIKFPGDIGGSAAVPIGDPLEYFTSHMQDTQGNIWFTNLDGLYKFDGEKWVEFNEEQLPSDICNKVIELSNNEIWVATKYGVAKQVGDSWIKYEKNRGIKGNNSYNLFEDVEHRLWTFANKDKRFNSLVVYENDKWKPFFKDNIKTKGNINRLIDLGDQLVAFSKKGLSIYNGKNWKSLTNEYKIEDDNFDNLTVAKNKSLWFSGQEGLYNLTYDTLRTVFQPEKNWKVTSIFENIDGDIWIGTDKNGIFVITNSEIQQYTVDNGLNDNQIKEIFEDKQRNIWVVTRGGISRFE